MTQFRCSKVVYPLQISVRVWIKNNITLPCFSRYVSTPNLRIQRLRKQSYDLALCCIGKTANFRIDANGTLDARANLLHATLKQNTFNRFVYLSSTSVYQLAEITLPDSLIPIDTKVADSIYNISKLLVKTYFRVRLKIHW